MNDLNLPEEDVKFGVLCIGAPGTGKSTFCKAMSEFLTDLERPHCVVNLDPANENLGYDCGIDIKELITLEDAMTEFKLGPNGGMLYCAEFLLTNYQWLADQIDKKFLAAIDGPQGRKHCQYFIFDLPGQVELYTNHHALKEIIRKLSELTHMNLVAAHLLDVSYLYDKYKFLSGLSLTMTSLIGMEMPFVTLITKVDMMKEFGRPDMPLDFYMGQTDGLKYLFYDEFQNVEDAEQNGQLSGFKQRFSKLTKNLCELLERFTTVNFTFVDISQRIWLTNALMRLDKGNGYYHHSQRLANEKETQIDYEAVEQYFDSSEAQIDLEEKYFD